jgi:hypothetical protein
MDPKYMGISHHDVAVQIIAGLYMSLLLDNIKGPSLPISSILSPVISTITDPFVIKSPKETCLNFDTSSITCALQQLHFKVNGTDHDVSIDDNNEQPCNTQQEAPTTHNVNDGQTVGFRDHVSAKHGNVSTRYNATVSLAKELASLLEGNCSMDKLEQYKEMLSDCIIKKKKKNKLRKQSQNASVGTMMSSNVQSNKKLKTH